VSNLEGPSTGHTAYDMILKLLHWIKNQWIVVGLGLIITVLLLFALLGGIFGFGTELFGFRVGAPSKQESGVPTGAFMYSIVPCADLGAPGEFEAFEDAAGRFVVGVGEFYSARGQQQTIFPAPTSGKMGIGGDTHSVLELKNLPAHYHDYIDAYFLEHQGHMPSDSQSVGGSLGGSQGVDNDNTRWELPRVTAESGSNSPIAQLPPYVALHACVKD